jgi:hypothetical protein
MTRLLPRSRSAATSLVFGANVSFTNACQAWKSNPGPAAPGFSPPEVIIQVKAIACELPSKRGLPLSRLSTADIVREGHQCGHRCGYQRQDGVALAQRRCYPPVAASQLDIPA